MSFPPPAYVALDAACFEASCLDFPRELPDVDWRARVLRSISDPLVLERLFNEAYAPISSGLRRLGSCPEFVAALAAAECGLERWTAPEDIVNSEFPRPDFDDAQRRAWALFRQVTAFGGRGGRAERPDAGEGPWWIARNAYANLSRPSLVREAADQPRATRALERMAAAIRAEGPGVDWLFQLAAFLGEAADKERWLLVLSWR